MVDRMIRATKADVSLYEEAEATQALQNEAITIVAIVAVVGALGSLIVGAATGDGIGSALVGAVFQGIAVMVGYFLWAYIAFFVGTRLFNGTADYGELLRTLGYAQSPNVLSFIPCIGFLAALWSLWLSVVAIRQALDFDTTKAVLTSIVGFIVYLILLAIVGSIFGVGAAAIGAIGGG